MVLEVLEMGEELLDVEWSVILVLPEELVVMLILRLLTLTVVGILRVPEFFLLKL